MIALTANYRVPKARIFPNNIEQAVATHEIVYDFHHCELTRQIMVSNLGIRLHTLVLNFRHLNTNETKIGMELLQDLPLLRRLVLDNPRFRIIYFETLHDNLPGLTSIELNNVYVTSGPPVTNVQPALNITRADCSYCRGQNWRNFGVYNTRCNL